MILVHEVDLQQMEDFLDYWAKPNKSTPNLMILEKMAKDLKKRCDLARHGYPPGSLPREVETSVMQGEDKVSRTCDYPGGCTNKTYKKRCFQHAERKTKAADI